MLNRSRVGSSVFTVFSEWVTGRGSFVKMTSVVPDGFEVTVDSELSSRRVWQDRQHIN